MNTKPDPSDLEQSPFDGSLSDLSIATETARARPLVDRSEPLPACDVFRIPSVLAVCQMVGIEDPDSVVHPFGGLCKACQLKDPPVETKLDKLWRQIHPTLAPGWFAINCCEQCYADAQVDSARLTANREFWEKVCPIEFRKDWDDRKGNGKLLKRVLNFDAKVKRGLIIHGVSESGKTRVVWRLLRKLAEEGVTWMFIESIDLIDEIPAAAFTVSLLIIDDLGNDHLTGPKEVRFLKLIRARTNWHRPTIITTQFNASQITDKFSQTATAKAVFRRLAESCDSIDARNP